MILELIYRSEKIPRKEIAKALELTPAAITLITTDLIQEGILVESSKRESSSRGRREVLLEINSKKFVSAGICITRNHVKLICIDLSAKILFQKKFRTTEFHRDPEQILAFAAKQLEALLSGTSILKKRTLVGIGISTLGIVNSNSGESINSYGVFDKRIKISPYFENRFHVPVYLVNNICACAHGEAFLSNSPLQSGRLLFIKYGPGVGSALLASDDYFNVDEYSAIQMAHVIMDPHGKPCICGNQGCLETLVSYDSIIQDLSDIFSLHL